MDKIILIGGGGHCKSVIDVIEQEGKYQIVGILDVSEKIGQMVLGYEIIGEDKDLEKYKGTEVYFIITIGQIHSANQRTKLFQILKQLNLKIATVVSPLAYVSPHAKINEGTVIMHKAIVNASAAVGANCIVNTKALIEHDAVIGNNCHISTGAIINGGVIIGDNSFVGSAAVTKEYIIIKENSFIKANSIVKS
jgi:sugar O-acyltransferase (sialic acid O-acetyltransferase NeuD family)